ncbi:insecticidal delta-endotoxin Cry8Ea1 family protein [Bacillus sp. RC92]|uniref:insecticidal delta-endotoxin Cry8Ea1 family protein n=1 Tax=Bacillus sp. RC92 TaxID=3156293 RepID=UPI003837E204
MGTGDFMKKKQKKILSIALATGVFAGTYIPTAYTAFAENEQKEDLQENQTKNINQNSLPIDSYGWFENPYKGVTFSQFIDAFNNNQWQPLLVNIKNKGDAGSGTISFLKGMMTTGLSLLPPPASLLASIWSVFIPTNDANGTDMWRQLETYIDEKIDSKINDYHKYLMGAEFNGAMSAIKEYQRVLQIYNDSKNSLKRVEEPGTPVIEAVRAADRKLKEFIAVIQTPEKSNDSVYQQITAPIFVQAANAHLLLQRDMILYGEEWGMDKDQWQGYKDNQKKLIQEYTNYAMKVYNDGLEKRKKEAEEINTQQPNRNTDRWNHINDYVREYTLSVLDFVDLFPATNPETYSKGVMQENSRQIYSSIKGAVIPQGGTGEGTTWENIQKILDSQEYKGDLHKLDIRSFDRIDAIQPWFSDKQNGGSNWTTPGWTGNASGGALKTLINPSDNPITRVKAQSSRTPNYIDFKFDTGGDNPYFGRYFSGGSYKEDIFEYPNQKLSQIHAFNRSTYPGFEGIDAVVFGFVDKNLTQSSTYLMTNMITTIPAAKYNRGMSNFQPQVESIHAKQKAMKTDTTNSYLAYGVEISKEQEYKIRYKVAANENSKISLSHRKPGGNYAKIDDTTIPITGNAADTVKGEYGSYKIVEGPIVKLTKGAHDLKLENSQGKFSLDQIELEPVERDQVIARDNFDDQQLNWINLGGIVNGGITGKAGMIGTNGDTWTYIQDQVLPFSKYTLSIKVKLNSNDGNERQKVTIFTDNLKHERITKTVELKGKAGYQEIQLEFITSRDLANTHVGILTSNGTSNVLFDDVQVIGAKKS